MVDPPSGAAVVPPSPSSHESYLKRKYFPELDGLRAVSVLIVVSVHMRDHVWGWLAGHLGVTIFFVLSGYLITRLALAEEHHNGFLNKRAFFIRRLLRLMPVYYAVLGIYCFLVFGLKLTPEKIEPFRQALPFYLIYFQEWPFFIGVNGSYLNIPFYQTWTLGIEEKFYLIWPLVGFVVWRRQFAWRCWGTAGLSILAALSPWYLGVPVGQFFFPYAQILIGCLVALLLDNRFIFDATHRIFTQFWIRVWVLTGFVCLHLCKPYVPEELSRLHQIGYALTTALMMIAVILNQDPLRWFLSLGPLLFVGRLSYGIYLVHLLALNAAEKVARPGSGHFLVSSLALVLTWGLATLMAYLLARIIERPCIALGRRLSSVIIQRSLNDSSGQPVRQFNPPDS